MFEYVGPELEENRRRRWPSGLRRWQLKPASMVERLGDQPLKGGRRFESCSVLPTFRTLTDNTRGVEDAYVVLLIFTY